ncbi:NAD(P)H-quinone oxidoreductase subunit F [Euhalothece natronophila Z-M001]|uniref:NAD(P)H-quinone oxidoreductase subunit F n=1 Tax=Euhalothece natronophila Z-M001 TaxID=522448 RepID=A0A5B8NLY6_9CHRO|nr:NAD(P)H-quinone oxidoreductase subunit F [Euhalothece natronophila]QDZ40292.1 NAD(P)H-quinone oxidoreductase subunit F [Euhalothece natronophila Z-M001]
MNLSNTIWLIPLYPLLGMGLSILWSPGMISRTGPRPSGYINTLMTFFALLHSLLTFLTFSAQSSQYFSVTWLNAASLHIDFEWSVSQTKLIALMVVTGLNLFAQIYAMGYLENDWGWARFYSLLAFFEAGICTLILTNSLFFGYVMLEILTLGTYLIIGYWFNQTLVITGARDAFLTKRVGDLFLLMGVVALYPLAGTWNYQELAAWAQTADLNPTTATLLSLALIAGPVGKCAQFPLHLWLDEAMEGPLPATILRNAVVVCTGAWVLISLQPIIAISPIGLTVTIAIGTITAIGASLIAIAQTDIKRILSYAVSAYLGLVFIAVGMGETDTALGLLLTYSLAMAVLVMAVGNIILSNITQNVTMFGGLWSRRPITGLSYLAGVVALIAVPPLGEFWSLFNLLDTLWATQPWLAGVVLAVNGLTAFSLLRLFCLVFLGETKAMTVRSQEQLWLMVLPTTISAGFVLHLPLFLTNWELFPELEAVFSLPSLGLISSSFLGIISAVLLYGKGQPQLKLIPQSIKNFFAYDCYTLKAYQVTVVFTVNIISRLIAWFDQYIVDGLVNLIGLTTVLSGQGLKYNNSGVAQSYFLSIIAGVMLFGFVVCFPFLV